MQTKSGQYQLLCQDKDTLPVLESVEGFGWYILAAQLPIKRKSIKSIGLQRDS